MRTVVGVFTSREEATAVLRDLNNIGIPPDDVAVAEGRGSKDHDKEWNRRNISAAAASAWGWMFAGLIPLVSERNLAGATALGAGVGAAGGMLAGIAFAAIQSASVGGPDHTLLAAVLGLLICGTCGGVAAAYYNMGVSHEKIALDREAEIDHGIVVAAHVIESREAHTIKVMQEHHAFKTNADEDPWRASGWTGPHPSEEPYPSDSEYRNHPAA